MFILWGGLSLLYIVSFVDTYFLQKDAGGLVMAMVALLFAALSFRSYRKRKQKKAAQKQ